MRLFETKPICFDRSLDGEMWSRAPAMEMMRACRLEVRQAFLSIVVLFLTLANIGGLIVVRRSRQRELAYLHELERQFKSSDSSSESHLRVHLYSISAACAHSSAVVK